SQVMICTDCGRFLSSRTPAPSSRSHSVGYDRSYACPVCHYVIREAKVIYALRQVIAMITDETIADIAQRQDMEGDRLQARSRDTEAEAARLQERKKRLTGAYLDGLIDAEDYRTLSDDMRGAADRLQAEAQ